MTIKQEELTYQIPAPNGDTLGRNVDLTLTYDDSTTNADGSYTVTNVTGTYQTVNSEQVVVHNDTVSYAAPNLYGSNDNELFITDDANAAYVTQDGITFSVSDPTDTHLGEGYINFFNNAEADAPPAYQEFQSDLPDAVNVEENPACYLSGTMILAEAGEKPVEELAIGELVVTGSGAMQPVKWIGRRSFSARFAGGKHRIQPIRIAAGALGDNLPKRDLWVSPCHAMLIDGLLISAALLVNGVTITQPEAMEDFDYFHIELEQHDVVVAEGALSETFLDAHSRNQFHNAAEFRARYPDARPDPGARFCAPRVDNGLELQAVLRKLKHRAIAA